MARTVEDYEAYYEGRRRLDAIGVSLPSNVRVLEMPVRWPKLTVDVLVRSLVLEGFTMAGVRSPTSSTASSRRIISTVCSR